MLADAERKVLRIIANFSAAHCRMPSLYELGRRSGKRQEAILKALTILEREGYIDWSPDDPDRITLLQAWEREDRGSGWQVYGSM